METMGLLTLIKTFPSKLRRLCVVCVFVFETLKRRGWAFSFPLCILFYYCYIETLSLMRSGFDFRGLGSVHQK